MVLVRVVRVRSVVVYSRHMAMHLGDAGVESGGGGVAGCMA